MIIKEIEEQRMILREKNKSKIEWDEIEYKFSNLKLRFGINQEKNFDYFSIRGMRNELSIDSYM